jgi:hypothetical protein
MYIHPSSSICFLVAHKFSSDVICGDIKQWVQMIWGDLKPYNLKFRSFFGEKELISNTSIINDLEKVVLKLLDYRLLVDIKAYERMLEIFYNK